MVDIFTAPWLHKSTCWEDRGDHRTRYGSWLMHRLIEITNKVVPQFGITKMVQITSITMGYGRYISTYYGL